MDAITLLNMLAPHLSNIDDDIVQNALKTAESYRPKCLPENKQIEAVALYAAYLLSSMVERENIKPGLVSEKEGDLQRTYGNIDTANTAKNYLARYNELNNICRSIGSITVGYNYGN